MLLLSRTILFLIAVLPISLIGEGITSCETCDDEGSKNKIRDSYPTYTIRDLGTLGADESRAIAINEKGQVLGNLRDRGRDYFFLWDENIGLKIIESPISFYDECFLNNKGQIAGTYQSEEGSHGFIWDECIGFLDIGSLGGNSTTLVAFNDKLQVIGNSNYKDDNSQYAFVWDHGKITDITKELNQQIPANWSHVNAVAINNLGHVALTASRQDKGGYWITKSFVCKEGVFAMLLSEKSPEAFVQVSAMDDYGNILVWMDDDKLWFISPSEGIKAYINRRGNIVLRNKRPMRKDCLLGNIKRDVDGNLYFGPGLWITKLLEPDGPFAIFGTSYPRIEDQNSRGWAVGQMNTFYPGSHAFLAIPQYPKDGK